MARRTVPLFVCILFDVIGMLTYILPGLGEFADIIWGPVSGLAFFLMFGGKKGLIGGVFSMAEEMMPGTDFIPTFTIAYFMQKSGRTVRTGVLPVMKTEEKGLLK